MSILWRSVSSAVLAVLFIFLVGYFQVRAESIELGLLLNWSLVPAQASAPAMSLLDRSVLFAIFGAVAALFLMRRRGLSGDTGIPPLVGGLTLLAISAWSMMTVNTAQTMTHDQALEATQTSIWETVFETGVLSFMTVGMTVLLLVIAVLRFLEPRDSVNPQHAGRGSSPARDVAKRAEQLGPDGHGLPIRSIREDRD